MMHSEYDKVLANFQDPNHAGIRVAIGENDGSLFLQMNSESNVLHGVMFDRNEAEKMIAALRNAMAKI